MNISATGLTAQTLRMDIISQNIANVDTTRTADGGPYKRKITLFQERTASPKFRDYFDRIISDSESGQGVRVSRVVEDNTQGAAVYEPNHPDADENGYVRKPNVNVVTEMVNMIAASRGYDSNVTAINITKSMMAKTLEISK